MNNKKIVDIKRISEELKESPIFNMSLSSKELFHSNFLAWLIETYPAEMWTVFSKYTDLEEKKFAICDDSVKREHNHIDLMFDVIEHGKPNTEENKIKIIIENKVKSLPYKKQLTDYSTKYIKTDACFILLSLSTPNHLIENNNYYITDDNQRNWRLLTYESLIKELKNIKFNFNLSDNNVNGNKTNYHNLIIKDYIQFVECLTEIDKITEISENEDYDWYEDIYKVLDRLRLADFYIKKKCENMANKIFWIIIAKYQINSNSICANSSIVNSTNGEFRLYYKLNERIEISIEVSRLYYRKMIHIHNQIKEKNKLKKFRPQFDANKAYSYFNEKEWFDFKHIAQEDNVYNPRNDYNQFGQNTKYKQCFLSKQTSINDIISYFLRDFEFIYNLKDKIIEDSKHIF